MKRIITVLAALTIPVAAALPARAQDWNSRDWTYWNSKGQNPTGFVDGLEWQINYAEQTGRISPRQAHWLRQREYEAKPIAWRVETGDASWEDRQQLNRDVDAIETTLTRSYHTYRGYRREDGWDNGWGGNGWGGNGWPR